MLFLTCKFKHVLQILSLQNYDPTVRLSMIECSHLAPPCKDEHWLALPCKYCATAPSSSGRLPHLPESLCIYNLVVSKRKCGSVHFIAYRKSFRSQHLFEQYHLSRTPPPEDSQARPFAPLEDREPIQHTVHRWCCPCS